MGRLIVFILVASLLWMGWWAFGSTALERTLSAWIDDRRAEGWAADVSDVSVAGFPNRFDTTLTEVRLTDPETGLAWQAPFLQLLALAYRPNQVIAVLPETHVLSTPFQTMSFSSDRTRGSIFLGASADLPLDRSTFIAENLRVSSTLGWEASLAEVRFATEPVPARKDAHRIGAEITSFDPSEEVRAALDPAGLLPSEIELFRLDMDMGFDAPWDRRAIEVARPQPTDLDLNELWAEWGTVTFRAAGELTIDENGVAEGEIDIRAVEWRRILDMAVSSGLLSDSFRPAIESALELVAGLSGQPDTLDAPLSFQQGFVSFGPIPLGPAPRFVIR